MWRTFFNKNKKEEQTEDRQQEILLDSIANLKVFLLGQVAHSVQSERLKDFAKTYFEASSQTIIDYLPELYLKIEEFITEISPEARFTRKELRLLVKKEFPLLIQQQNFGFIFQNEIPQEIYLGKFFIAAFLDEIVHLFGRGESPLFLSSKEWVDCLPGCGDFPLEDNLRNKGKTPELQLRNLSHHICNLLETKMGGRFTRKVLDRQYESIARKYKYLSSFPYVVSLIPRRFLDTDKLGLLSHHQLSETLLEQVKHLEDLNVTLADRNETLERTKDDLKKALAELESRSGQLEATQRAQEALLNELKESNQELEQFAYVASHDLQEPLRTIEGYIQLITKEVELTQNPKLSEFISHTTQGLSRMQELIRDLLEYSRVGQTEDQLQKIDLDILIEIVCYNLRRIIEERGARITTSFSGQPVAYRTQMIQLFQNLISNAIKFCEKGKIPHIQISGEEREKDWLFAVKDNGIGIKPEDQAHVFALFKRLSPISAYTGNGIGLAICKKIVDQHQGEIWIDSTPEEGSTFFFTINKEGISTHQTQPLQ